MHRFGIDPASIRHQSGIDPASIWHRFGIDLASIWHRFGIDLGSIRDRFGIDLGSFWHRVGDHRGAFGRLPGPSGRPKNIKNKKNHQFQFSDCVLSSRRAGSIGDTPESRKYTKIAQKSLKILGFWGSPRPPRTKWCRMGGA